MTRTDGSRHYSTLSYSSQRDPRVMNPSWGATIFQVDASRTNTDEKLWGPNTRHVEIRGRTMNGNGQTSGWSPFERVDMNGTIEVSF